MGTIGFGRVLAGIECFCRELDLGSGPGGGMIHDTY